MNGWRGGLAAAARARATSPQRRWTLQVRDLHSRTAWVILAVHVPSGTVALYASGTSATVLEPRDLRQLRRQLDDALACVIADGGEYGA